MQKAHYNKLSNFKRIIGLLVFIGLFSIAPKKIYRPSNYAIAKVVALILFASFIVTVLYIYSWHLFSIAIFIFIAVIAAKGDSEE